MNIHRFSEVVETIVVSDLSVKIACALRNKCLLNRGYGDIPPLDYMSYEQKQTYVIEEAAILIDEILKEK